MRSFAFLLASLASCSHAPDMVPDEPALGTIEASSDPSFFDGDPATAYHCTVDAACPKGSLCHPGSLVCFTTSPPPRIIDMGEVDRSSDHGPCRLVRIYFPVDSAVLVAEARRSLLFDARCLIASNARHVVLAGFTDARGEHEHNRALSRRRANEARAALRRAGVTIPIDVVAEGTRHPLMIGATELAFAYNRRVEFRP